MSASGLSFWMRLDTGRPRVCSFASTHGAHPRLNGEPTLLSVLRTVGSPLRAQLGATRAGKARATNLGLSNKRAPRLLTDRRARARARARASDPNLGTRTSDRGP